MADAKKKKHTSAKKHKQLHSDEVLKSAETQIEETITEEAPAPEVPVTIDVKEEPSLHPDSELQNEDLPVGMYDSELGEGVMNSGVLPEESLGVQPETEAVDTTFPKQEERNEKPISIPGSDKAYSEEPEVTEVPEEKPITVTSKIRKVMEGAIPGALEKEKEETPEEPAEETPAEEVPEAEDKTIVLGSAAEAEDLSAKAEEEQTLVFDPVKQEDTPETSGEEKTPDTASAEEPVKEEVPMKEPKFLRPKKNPVLSALLKVLLTLAVFVAGVAGTYLFTLWFCSGQRNVDAETDYISQDGYDIKINKSRTWYVTPNDSTYTAVIYDINGAVNNPNNIENTSLLTETNLHDGLAAIKELDPSFILFQNVDHSSTRSDKKEETEVIASTFVHYSKMYCPNYKTMYEFWPIGNFRGMRNSGFYTLSKYHVNDSYRKLLPCSEHMPAKFFAKSACVSVNVIPVSGSDRDLYIVNVDFSDYPSGASWNAQYEHLKEILAGAVERDEFIVIGGNFQANLTDSANHLSANSDNEPVLDASVIWEGFHMVVPSNANELYTKIEENKKFTDSAKWIQDGFIVSDNIEATAQIIDTGFRYSNHNPVELSFKLIEE